MDNFTYTIFRGRRDVHAGSSDMNDENTIFEQRSLGKVAYGPRLIWKRCLCAILYAKNYLWAKVSGNSCIWAQAPLEKLPLSQTLLEKSYLWAKVSGKNCIWPRLLWKVTFEPNSTGKNYLWAKVPGKSWIWMKQSYSPANSAPLVRDKIYLVESFSG